MFENSVRRLPRPQDVAQMTTSELRAAFLMTDLFVPGQLTGRFTDLDRLAVGAVVPTMGPIELPNHRETGRGFFLEQRELGAINTGGPGVVHADTKKFSVAPLGCVYAGVGTKKVFFESQDAKSPAKFYFLSCPAHARFPAAAMTCDEAVAAPIGAPATANVRTIRRYIHPEGIRSCQLVMGYTELAEGSVWNTFPPHTHTRRTEIYFYFDLGENVLVHLMGEPGATRHLFIQNEQAVLSPAWSIHAGCGTAAYKFIWGMAGENQVFNDMDGVKPSELR